MARDPDDYRLVTDAYEAPPVWGLLQLPVLTFLRGQPWDSVALGLIESLQPSALRVLLREQPVPGGHALWRVTVTLAEDRRTIVSIVQEARVGLSRAFVGGGRELKQCLLERGIEL